MTWKRFKILWKLKFLHYISAIYLSLAQSLLFASVVSFRFDILYENELVWKAGYILTYI